ncbi:hypothetical protein [Streptomyces sp. MS2.AVA.5]|uniref:Uncharacterized protein n=1 Tax=Streptomyces achmelvichensis TaxID=3134111 RepID=A0ACC6Q2N8_9ACTN
MGEEKKEPTPEQQQAADATQIESQFGATDALERFATVMDKIGLGGGSGPGGFFGTTSFEEAQLNVMLDLIEHTNPADLENAGEALVKAKTALNKAAKELADYVNKVEWKGEAATEFKRFGTALAEHAYALGTFANAAGKQMQVASTGLTSVKNSMPRERDTRLVAKKPEAFALAPAKETNPEYIEAVKVEKNRQEAINQMNRLASFYAVSESSLKGQEAPRFPQMLKADVPAPRSAGPVSESQAETSGAETKAVSQATAERAVSVDERDNARTESRGVVAPVPDRNTSMEIDSVTAPPAPTTGPGPAQPVTATGTPTTGGGPVPPMTSGFANPVKGGTARSVGTSGGPRVGGGGTSSPVGRATGGNGSPSVGRSGTAGNAGPVGRPGATGTGTPAGRATGTGTPAGRATGTPGGRAGGPVAGGQSPVTGRGGAAGQPTAGRAGTKTSGPRSGRADGIVGGTPQRPAGGSSGSRIPRGTVIGGEGPTAGRSSAARPSQSGVVGAGPAQSAARPAGRGTPSSNGVVGTPRSAGAGGSRSGAGGFTTGGAGLSGSRPGQRQRNDEEQESSGSARPDYLTEDEETWAVRRRGAVPPVID